MGTSGKNVHKLKVGLTKMKPKELENYLIEGTSLNIKEIAAELRTNIHEANSVAWGEGKQTSEGAVHTKRTRYGHTIEWVGPYVDYLEYGAGTEGKLSPHEIANAAGYEYNVNKKLGDTWIVPTNKTDGDIVITSGWVGQAPFYKTIITNPRFYKRLEGTVRTKFEKWVKAALNW